MTKIIAFVSFVLLVSCTEHNGRELIKKNEPNRLDTLRFTENMRTESRLEFTWDKFTIDSLIPRETWVKINVKGFGVMSNILEHSNLFLESVDSTFHIQKISNNEFRIFIKKNYSGYEPAHGGECLTMDSYVQPKKGYILESYWLKKGIIFPSKTSVFMHYLPIEEKTNVAYNTRLAKKPKSQ